MSQPLTLWLLGYWFVCLFGGVRLKAVKTCLNIGGRELGRTCGGRELGRTCGGERSNLGGRELGRTLPLPLPYLCICLFIFLFVQLDEQRSLQSKGGHTRRTAGWHFVCCCMHKET